MLIGNDCTKRMEWPLGRVVEVFPGKNGIVRVVRLLTAKGRLVRPVQKLYYLEVDSDVDPKELREIRDKKVKPKSVYPNQGSDNSKQASNNVDLSVSDVPTVPYVTKSGRTVKRIARL